MGITLNPNGVTGDPEISELLERCVTYGFELTKWELSFVADVTDQWDRTGRLSEGQLRKLRQIVEARGL